MKPCKHLYCKGRRDFFRKAFFLGVAALFSGAKDRRAAAGMAVPSSAAHTQGRYRLTAHIRRYYERASF
jgi:hypothetical protein